MAYTICEHGPPILYVNTDPIYYRWARTPMLALTFVAINDFFNLFQQIGMRQTSNAPSRKMKRNWFSLW